jgi:hypothetical protein
MSQFIVTISACPRVRVAMGRNEHITARVLGPMYRDAVIAEMHASVRNAVTVQLNNQEKAITNGVEVRLGRAVRSGMGFGAVTNRAMSYMFELRDAVNEVIRTFVPPPEAWVDDAPIAPPPGVDPVSETEAVINEPAGSRQVVEGAVPNFAPLNFVPPATPPQLTDEHVHALAVAAQSAHYPSLVNEIEHAAPAYIDDAKAFAAMFNKALKIIGQLFPLPPLDVQQGAQNYQSPPPPLQRVPDHTEPSA